MFVKKPKFVYRCIRVKDVKHPLKSRCGKWLGKNGLLCDGCFMDASRGKIPVLMCGDVSNIFGIPFKNQVFVWVDISGKIEKPVQKKDVTDRAKKFKKEMIDGLNKMDINKLKKYYTESNLKNIKSLIKQYGEDEYKLRFFITKEIIEYYTVFDGKGEIK